ncbi:transposase [Maribacter litopenaei]|uniref:Transposase n=1 Tax=Maribacter litopenaei TaxID=2976127 RepID=A0ABY5Y9L9_9FLAO|nr:transposase [Maribacter litopenaei]UWX55743.1 transposase [Maribacter litopenaei]UWX55750.1 transposase [Maribacter litopenaei]
MVRAGRRASTPWCSSSFVLWAISENIISDRKLIDHCSMRLDILYFIGYDIDEELPWHSTISRTRQLYPESVFEEVFTKVLAMCVDAGMVSGHTQAIDSAPVKANASMDTLELKVPEDELDEHLRKVRALSSMDKGEPHRKSKGDRSDKGQRTISANKNELDTIKGRNRKWARNGTKGREPGTRWPSIPVTRPIIALRTPMRASA